MTSQQQHLLLGSSYYFLYSAEKSNNNQETSGNTHNTPSSQNNNEDNSSSLSFWQEFEWTETDKQKIIQLLKQNERKCDVIENAITPQRGQYIIDKYEKDAQMHWDNFYTFHENKFFKDRHYLNKAFPDEFNIVYANHHNANHKCDDKDKNSHETMNGEQQMIETNIIESNENFVITEIGCGVGNTVLPLLELNPYVLMTPSTMPNSTLTDSKETKRVIIKEKKKLVVWGLDFSSVAIELLQKDARFINAFCKVSSSSRNNNNDRARAQVWDITSTHPKDIMTDKIYPLSSNHTNYHDDNNDNQQSPKQCLESSSNISLLLFVLSAISPSKMKKAAQHVASTLKPGGILVLRDYGRYDEAQIKLGTSRNKRLDENFYVKNDGTRCYYFSLDDIIKLFGDNPKNNDGDDDSGAGLEILELKYVQRVYKNRADEESRRRVWVQGRFRKPL